MNAELESLVLGALIARGLQIVELGEGWVEVRDAEGRTHGLGLGNLARAIGLAAPERRAAVVERYLRLWLEHASGAEESPEREDERLFPRLLSPGFEAPGLGGPWVEPLGEGALQLALVVDAPESLRLVRALDLPRWGLSVREAKRRAFDNLWRSSAAIAAALAERPDPGAPFELSTGDGHDAARLLILAALAPGHRGLLALVPARDLLLAVPLVGPRDWARARAEALARRRWAARAVRGLPYPLSPELFWCSEALIAPIPLLPDAPAGEELLLPDAVRALALGEDA